MSVSESRGPGLAAVVVSAMWFGSLALALAVLLALYIPWAKIGSANFVEGDIGLDRFKQYVTHLCAVYGPFIGLIATFYLAGDHSTPLRKSGVATFTIFALSLCWNAALLVWPLAVLLLDFPIEDALKASETVTAGLTWIVAPPLIFYFFTDRPDGPR